jgi:5'-nucleotidase
MEFTHLLRSALLAGATAAAALAGGGCADPVPDPPLKGQVHLTLIHTSDMHSRLFPYNLQLGQIDAGLGLGSAGTVVNVGGAARVSHIVGRERARADRVLHLDGGDCFQGAPIFNYFSGEAEIRTQSAIGTDAMIVANHEFDRGAVNLAKQLQQWAPFPVLAANYQFDDTKQPGTAPLGSIIKPFTVFDLQGLRVGVVGMGNLSSLTSLFNTPNSLGITPLNTVETVQFYVDLLRPMVDLVVFVTHLGVDVDQRMIENTTGIDVVLGGHNHIVLQPPKRVQDCSAHSEDDGMGGTRNYILLDKTDGGQTADPTALIPKDKRYCKPRNVILAHSGAFAKYVGRLDLVVSNDPADLADRPYDKSDGFEVLTHEYHLFPVTENTPEDPIVSSLLEPYHQGLDSLANLDLLVGYALDGSKRNSTSGGDSALGNLIATAMWLRLGIQTDFSLTNSTGIRTDLVPGPVTIEQMFNIFPFDNAITKMNVSGVEVQNLFDFVARRSTGRGCVSQVQIAGARVVMNCTQTAGPNLAPGKATNIYIGTWSPIVHCQSDADCPGGKGVDKTGSCDVEAQICWQPIQPTASYELATSDYLAGGGSGFTVLKRNTTQNNTGVQQRDALVDYMRAGFPCGSDEHGKLAACSQDADCAGVGDHFVCACPEAAIEGEVCTTGREGCGGKGACVLSQCRADLAAFQRATCEAAPNASVKASCEKSLAPCSAAGEQCKFLACVDKRLGSFSDGRVRMVGQ